MLKSVFAVLTTSYIAWYFENHEHAAVYPFDTIRTSPSEAGAPALSEAQFVTEDGANLIVWKTTKDIGDTTIFYLSGNAGSLKDRATRLETFVSAGFNVVAPAYRGSSGSSGSPDEDALISDARALIEEIPAPVIVYGESLGAAVAIQLAADGLGDAVVLEAPFTSLAALVAAQYPMEELGETLTQRWDSMAHVGAIEQPLLIIHGEDDRLVPFTMGQTIFNAVGSSDKTFLGVAGSGHTELWTDAVVSDLFAFLARDFLE